MERSVLEMLSDRSSAPTLLGCRPSARKSLGRSQKRFQLLAKSSFCSLHHDNNHSFKANCLLNLSCPRRYVGSGPDTMIVVAGDVLRTVDQAPEVPLQCLRLPQLGVVHARVQHGRSDALVVLQDHGYLRRNIENTSTRETVCAPDDGVYLRTAYLWASTQDVSSAVCRSLGWACFSSSLLICLSMASSSSCTECSSNASSPALKGRHKSTIKVSSSETMVMCVNRVLAVLASLAAAALAVLTGYKLIADSGNQYKTSDNKALCFCCRMR